MFVPPFRRRRRTPSEQLAAATAHQMTPPAGPQVVASSTNSSPPSNSASEYQSLPDAAELMRLAQASTASSSAPNAATQYQPPPPMPASQSSTATAASHYQTLPAFLADQSQSSTATSKSHYVPVPALTPEPGPSHAGGTGPAEVVRQTKGFSCGPACITQVQHLLEPDPPDVRVVEKTLADKGIFKKSGEDRLGTPVIPKNIDTNQGSSKRQPGIQQKVERLHLANLSHVEPGTYNSNLPAGLQEFGYDATASDQPSDLKTHLEKDGLVIAMVKWKDAKNVDHYHFVTVKKSVDAANQSYFEVFDPGSTKEEGSFRIDEHHVTPHADGTFPPFRVSRGGIVQFTGVQTHSISKSGNRKQP